LTSEWWIKNVPRDYIAYWNLNNKTIKDTSATAIAALSLLKLSYWEFAKNTIESLLRGNPRKTRERIKPSITREKEINK